MSGWAWAAIAWLAAWMLLNAGGIAFACVAEWCGARDPERAVRFVAIFTRMSVGMIVGVEVVLLAYALGVL